MVCNEHQKIQDEEMSHMSEYTDDYHDLDEDELENLTYDEERSYLKDPAKEDAFYEAHYIKQGSHLSECDDADCQRVRDNWKAESSLAKYIK